MNTLKEAIVALAVCTCRGECNYRPEPCRGGRDLVLRAAALALNFEADRYEAETHECHRCKGTGDVPDPNISAMWNPCPECYVPALRLRLLVLGLKE